MDTWLDLCEAGTAPTPDQFGDTQPEVFARFLRHRSPGELAGLKVLAGPSAFDRPLFAALIERFHIGLSLPDFADLCALSIIEPGADGRWRLHALMREHLRADLDPDLRTELAACLFDWFDARCQPPSPREIEPAHEAALREAFDHRDTEDAEAALAWFWQREQVFDDAARHTLLEPLYRRAVALAEDRLGPAHPGTATALSWLAQLLQDTNRLAEAEPLMRRAVLILLAFTRDTGHRHPHPGTGLGNYRRLLLAQTEDPAEIGPHLASLGPEAGLAAAAWETLLAAGRAEGQGPRAEEDSDSSSALGPPALGPWPSALGPQALGPSQ